MKGIEKKSDRYYIFIEDHPGHMESRCVKGEPVTLPRYRRVA